jgi:CubicO group peptidase (beta-lactamase class C family)
MKVILLGRRSRLLRGSLLGAGKGLGEPIRRCQNPGIARKEPGSDLSDSAQRARPNSSPSNKVGLLMAVLAGLIVGILIWTRPANAQSATESIWPTKEWQISTPEEEGMDSKELAQLIDWGISHSFDSFLIVRHGRIVAEAYYAPYAPGIPHALYSVTKSVISTLTAIAWKEGLLDSTSHRVLDFFDRSSIANLDSRKEAITVQNLLDMTSGLEWTEQLGDSIPAIKTDEQAFSSPDWVKFILDRPMSSAPGDIFNYNSGNPHLLSAILTKLTGSSVLDYAKAKLFGPLGISDVSWFSDPQGISSGGFGLWLEPRDMAKIGYLYLRNGKWEGKQLLPDSWIDKVRDGTIASEPIISSYARRSLPTNRYSNLFWELADKHGYLANGRYGQNIIVFPDLDVVAVTTGRVLFGVNEFADLISGSVRSDSAIPADPAGAERLVNRIRDVSTEKPTPIGPAPKTEASISGKVYRFLPNQINVKSMSLTLTDPQPSYDAELYAIDPTRPAPRFAGPIGFDGRYKKGRAKLHSMVGNSRGQCSQRSLA